MNQRRILALVILGGTVLFTLAPLFRNEDVSVPLHHFFHVLMIVGASVSAWLFARPNETPARRNMGWLILAVVSPLFAMFLMWPSDYSIFERAPALHVFQHLGLVFLGFVTGYAGQRYTSGTGVITSMSLWIMGLLAIGGFGVTAHPAAIAAATSASVQIASAHSTTPKGAQVFAQNCASCHGAHGAGGFGPSLLNEIRRKNLAQTEDWIENPAPPMPKLYPGTLSESEVHDVAEYVESLR